MSGEEIEIDDPTNPGGDMGWITNLRPLAKGGGSIAAGLATIGSDPEAWVYNLIAVWLVDKVIGAVQFVLGWFLFAVERTVSIILGVSGPLSSPLEMFADAVVGAIETIYSAAYGVAASAGLAGPPAAAFAVAVVSAVLAALAYAVVKSIPGSDALEGGLEALR